jgi:hypothetical protein
MQDKDTTKTRFGQIKMEQTFYWYGARYKKIEPNVAVDTETGMVIIFNDPVQVYIKTEEGENKKNGEDKN